MSITKRLFISIELPRNVAEQISRVVSSIRGVQLHPPKNFHITIKFIGETPIELLSNLESLMDFVGSSFSPFVVSFVGLKIIESRLRLLVANPDTLAHMRQTFEHNLTKLNLFHEDTIQYEPHITLGKTVKDFIPTQLDFDFNQIKFEVNRIGLFETIRGEKTADFILLKSSLLRK